MVIDGIYIYTSLKEAVWADGIDIVSQPRYCDFKCTIATGDDCIIFVCGIPEWGPNYPCENITVTNCRLSSASAAIKFSEGNSNLIQNIAISNCAIFDCNRGITMAIATGGTIRDVVISNITMDLHRFDWFWDGDANAFNIEIHRTSEWNDEPPKPGEPGPGLIKDIIFRDMIVRCQGTSEIAGHPERPLEGITFDNIKFFISSDPNRAVRYGDFGHDFSPRQELERFGTSKCNGISPPTTSGKARCSLEDVDGLAARGIHAATPRGRTGHPGGAC